MRDEGRAAPYGDAMKVIFGATGKVGGAVVAELRRRGLGVKAVLRDVSSGEHLARLGCALASADLQDPRAVERAMKGADGVLVLCPVLATAGDLLADAQRTIDALGSAVDAARPGHVVALSDYGAHRAAGTGLTMIFHRLEARLSAAPVPTTFLRSAEHMENWSRQVPVARARGVLASLHQPLTRLFPMVAAADVGLLAAELLAGPAPPPGSPRVTHVEGPRRYAVTEIADVLARLVARPVGARELPRERWVSALVSGGLGESYAQLVAELQDAQAAGVIDVEPGHGEPRRGRTELADALT